MFLIAFAVIFFVLILLYVGINALAQSRASGPAPERNWTVALLVIAGIAFVGALIVEGLASVLVVLTIFPLLLGFGA